MMNEHIQSLIDSLAEDYSAEYAQALVVYGIAAVDSLLAALNCADIDPYGHDTFAEILITILSTTGDSQITDLLVPLIGHENADVRQRVVVALGDTGASEVVSALRPVLDDRNDAVRRAAAYTLIGLIYGPDVVRACVAALQDAHPLMRHIAARSLAYMGVTEAMLTAALNDSPAVRRVAVYYLGRKQVAEAFDMLVNCLEDSDEDVCRGAIWALGNLGIPRAINSLLVLLNSPSPQVVHITQEALQRLGYVTH